MAFTLLNKRILCIGDSITYDTISPTEGAYRYYLSPLLCSYFRIPSIDWCGNDPAVGLEQGGNKMVGASGRRVDEILSSYSPSENITRWSPSIVIIHLGTNDMTQLNSGTWVGGSVALSISNYSTLLNLIFAANPNAVVVACKIIPNQTAGADANIVSWNTALATMIAGHAYSSRIITPDLYAKFKEDVTWATDYMADNTHPNSAGKAVIANTISDTIQSAFPRPIRGPVERKGIKPHLYSLSYVVSTATTLGTSNILDTTLPWAVSMDINMAKGKFLTTNQGILCLKTDQGHPFIFLALRGGNARYIEFGAWTSSPFGRFFANVNSEINLFNRIDSGWHQLTFTYDGVSRSSATSYKFYLDGVPVNITSGAGLASSTNQNAIGAVVAGGVAGTFSMSSLAIWNGGSVMTAAQAANFYFNNIMPSGPTLKPYYQHSDGSGATLTDSNLFQNGTIGTATWITQTPTKERSAATTRSVASTRTVIS